LRVGNIILEKRDEVAEQTAVKRLAILECDDDPSRFTRSHERVQRLEIVIQILAALNRVRGG